MIDKAKKQKKGSISEEDMSTLLHRYTATTVLALLQEVAHTPDGKLNWKALVSKTSTGISNAREYQMLWRHIAYRDALLEKVEGGAEPLDDDSDLEFELEPSPSVNNEATAEAAACVKVLISSSLPSYSSLPNSSVVEAPLTINIPNGQSCRVSSENAQPGCSMRGMNITIPVSVQKQNPATATSVEALDGNGTAAPRRKRKPWSDEEDKALIAAVQKYGVGNWANIEREEFTGYRTANQLAQRWAIIKKRNPNVNQEGKPVAPPQPSAALLAARSALSRELDMPDRNFTAASTNNSVLKTSSSDPALPVANVEASDQVQNQSQQGSIVRKTSPSGPVSPAIKPRVGLKKLPAKSNPSSGSILDATAVAAGARIGSPEAADKLFKAAQANNAVYVMTSGGSSIKPLMPAASTRLEAHANVHYYSTGLSVKSAALVVEDAPCASAPSLNMPSKQCNSVTTSPAVECTRKQVPKAAEEINVSKVGSGLIEPVQQNGACLPAKESTGGGNENKAGLLHPEAELKNPGSISEHPNVKLMVGSGQMGENLAEENAVNKKMTCLPTNESGSRPEAEQSCENGSMIKKQAETSSNLEVSRQTEAGDALQ